jgi:hypothetical protein
MAEIRRAAAGLPSTLAFLILSAVASLAASSDRPATIDDFAASVPEMPGKTWLDLLRQVFPDIAEAETGNAGAIASAIIPLRSIGAADESWLQCDGGIKIRNLDARPAQLVGRRYLIVTMAIPNDCAGPLALYDATGKLVDAVNVKGDQHVSFSGEYVRSLGTGGALVIASSWHDNSNQSYDLTMPILARPEGFSSIGDVFALGSRTCREVVSEETAIRVVRDGALLARIDVEVRRRIQKLAEDCQTKLPHPAVALFRGSWRWNTKKGAYEAHRDELDRLAAWNQKHF